MITPDYLRMMASYNTEMNRRLHTAAANLTDAQRTADRGAFWKSIHGMLVHLYWGDSQWMSRFDGWAKLDVPIKESAGMIEDFAALRAMRVKADADIEAWAGRVESVWLDGDMVWFSSAAQREMRQARGKLVTHFFNHQTHHRGQVHAMLTASGQDTGDTDLHMVVPDAD